MGSLLPTCFTGERGYACGRGAGDRLRALRAGRGGPTAKKPGTQGHGLPALARAGLSGRALWRSTSMLLPPEGLPDPVRACCYTRLSASPGSRSRFARDDDSASMEADQQLQGRNLAQPADLADLPHLDPRTEPRQDKACQGIDLQVAKVHSGRELQDTIETTKLADKSLTPHGTAPSFLSPARRGRAGCLTSPGSCPRAPCLRSCPEALSSLHDTFRTNAAAIPDPGLGHRFGHRRRFSGASCCWQTLASLQDVTSQQVRGMGG